MHACFKSILLSITYIPIMLSANAFACYSDTETDQSNFWNCQKSAENNDAHAQAYVGKMYAYGLGVKQDFQKAFHWYEKAAQQGLAHAQWQVGRFYLQGRGTPQDKQAAADWLLSAARQGHVESSSELANLIASGEVSVKTAESLKLLQNAAKLGDAKAQWQLAIAFLYGNGIQKNPEQALSWFKKSADQLYSPALFNLAEMYHSGNGVASSPAIALRYYQQAEKLNHAPAMNNLAVFYEQGIETATDIEQAFRLYERAANLGYAVAQYNVGRFYEAGLGVAKNAYQAVKHFRSAADQHYVPAMNALGRMYFYGKGAPSDHKRAMKWFNLSASQGDRTGRFYVNRLKVEGKGVKRDITAGLTVIRELAKNDFAAARFYLGRLTLKGKHVDKDESQGIRLIKLAAEQGLPEAISYLDELEALKRQNAQKASNVSAFEKLKAQLNAQRLNQHKKADADKLNSLTISILIGLFVIFALIWWLRRKNVSQPTLSDLIAEKQNKPAATLKQAGSAGNIQQAEINTSTSTTNAEQLPGVFDDLDDKKTQQPADFYDNHFLEIAKQELHNNTIDKNIWDKAMGESPGDLSRAELLYLKYRVHALMNANQN